MVSEEKLNYWLKAGEELYKDNELYKNKWIATVKDFASNKPEAELCFDELISILTDIKNGVPLETVAEKIKPNKEVLMGYYLPSFIESEEVYNRLSELVESRQI